jgi:hypothetical protein
MLVMVTHGCWAAHELGELVCNLWRIHDLVNTPAITELRIGIVHRVLVVL